MLARRLPGLVRDLCAVVRLALLLVLALVVVLRTFICVQQVKQHNGRGKYAPEVPTALAAACAAPAVAPAAVAAAGSG
jgi:hypothetical protein